MEGAGHHAENFIGELDAAYLAFQYLCMQVLVPLDVDEELQRVVFKEVELILIEPSAPGVIEKQSKKERPLVLIISLTDRLGKVHAAIRFLVYS